MPLGQIIAEAVAQLAMEAGGEAIKHRFGWKGCVAALLVVIAIVAVAWWCITR